MAKKEYIRAKFFLFTERSLLCLVYPPAQLIILLVVILLIFGTKKIKKCWLRSWCSSERFQKAMKEDEKVKDAEFKSIDNETASAKKKKIKKRKSRLNPCLILVFSELILLMVLGLVVLGPKRLPITIHCNGLGKNNSWFSC